MKYESAKYCRRPSPPVSDALLECMPPAVLQAYALVRYSSPMAALLTELVDADVLPEKYQVRAAKLLMHIQQIARKQNVRKG